MRAGEIQGWFDFQDLYAEQVDRVVSGHFVEIGCWLGKSTVYLADLVKRSGKRIHVDAVDTWEGTPNEPAQMFALEQFKQSGVTLYQRFLANLTLCGVADIVLARQGASTSIAREFAEQQLDFVFIDGDHSYEAVRADIGAWLPKVKPGGVLAGHDIDQQGVKRAVQELLPHAAPCSRNCWRVTV